MTAKEEIVDAIDALEARQSQRFTELVTFLEAVDDNVEALLELVKNQADIPEPVKAELLSKISALSDALDSKGDQLKAVAEKLLEDDPAKPAPPT